MRFIIIIDLFTFLSVVEYDSIIEVLNLIVVWKKRATDVSLVSLLQCQI